MAPITGQPILKHAREEREEHVLSPTLEAPELDGLRLDVDLLPMSCQGRRVAETALATAHVAPEWLRAGAIINECRQVSEPSHMVKAGRREWLRRENGTHCVFSWILSALRCPNLRWQILQTWGLQYQASQTNNISEIMGYFQ